MKTTGIVSVLAATAAAQSLPGDLITRLKGVGLNGCQIECVATSVVDTSCHSADLKCACKAFQSFADSILSCNTDKCSSPDKGLAQRVAGFSCSGLVPIGGSGSSSIPSGTDTSSAGDGGPTYSAPPPPTYGAPPPPVTYTSPAPPPTYTATASTGSGYPTVTDVPTSTGDVSAPPPISYPTSTGDVSAPPPISAPTSTEPSTTMETSAMSIPESSIGTMSTSPYGNGNGTVTMTQGTTAPGGSASTSVVIVEPSHTGPASGTEPSRTGEPTLQPTAGAVRPAIALGAVAAALFAL